MLGPGDINCCGCVTLAKKRQVSATEGFLQVHCERTWLNNAHVTHVQCGAALSCKDIGLACCWQGGQVGLQKQT
jgi:hypothetical protein